MPIVIADPGSFPRGFNAHMRGYTQYGFSTGAGDDLDGIRVVAGAADLTVDEGSLIGLHGPVAQQWIPVPGTIDDDVPALVHCRGVCPCQCYGIRVLVERGLQLRGCRAYTGIERPRLYAEAGHGVQSCAVHRLDAVFVHGPVLDSPIQVMHRIVRQCDERDPCF